MVNGAFGDNFKIGASATAAVIRLAAGGNGGPAVCTTMANPSFMSFDPALDLVQRSLTVWAPDRRGR